MMHFLATDRTAILALSFTAILSFSDTCNMWFGEVGSSDPPAYVYLCEGDCDSGNCHEVTISIGSTTATKCFCGGSESNVECAGWIKNTGGTITWECSNYCGNGCVSDTGPIGQVCRCY